MLLSLQSDPWQYSSPGEGDGEAEVDEEPSIWLPVGLLMLIVSAVASVYSTQDDPRDLAFAAFSYAALLALLLCIHAMERRRAAAEQAHGLKAAVWALSATLNVGFAWRVAEMMPLVLAAAVWALVVIFLLASFYALILYRPADADSPAGDGEVEEEEGVCSYKKKISPVEEV